MASAAAAIAGIHEFPKRSAGSLSALQIKAECAARALEDAGLSWGDVDAVYDAGEAGRMQGLTIAEYFGITPRVVDTTAVGGSSYEFHAAHAASAIAEGKANVALLTYGSTAHSQARAIGTGGRAAPDPQPAGNMERPYGLTLVGNYAMVARRHMAEHGTTPEQLAEIAVTTRRHAMRNPQAVAGLADIGFRDVREITVDDVLGSRLIADPLHLLECCIVSDGGGAVVIVSPAVAAGIAKPPAWILGTGEAVGYPAGGADLTTTAAIRSGSPGHPGGPGLRQEGRGRAVRRGRPPRVRPARRSRAEHRRRRPVLQPPGHAGHLPAHRGHPAAARGVDRPGARRPPGRRAR